jgi:lipopolysaccharide transport system permease protein
MMLYYGVMPTIYVL